MTETPSSDPARAALFQQDFPAEEFIERRQRIFDAIGDEAMALIQGAAPIKGFDIFSQTHQFYYCCGLEAPQAYLLLDGATRTATIYLPHPPEKQRAEGAALSTADAEAVIAATGVVGVFGLEALSEHIAAATVVYTPHSPAEQRTMSRDELSHRARLVAADPWDSEHPREEMLIKLIRERAECPEIRDLSPILDRMRSVKSPREVDVLRRAGAVCAQAIVEAIRATQPGMMEYHLGAISNCVYQLHDMREGYRPIIAGQGNAWHAHYFQNNCMLNDGEMVLMDVAPDSGNYTSDIGRMWPVGGTYAPWQRELYGFIVRYHTELLARIRPGVTADDVMDQAAEIMAGVIEATTFSKDIFKAAAERTLTFRGHMSHPVGLAVHDVGPYRDRPLEPGVVLTVDPQMWIPQERIYVRVEDTVVITEDGMENLTAAAPLDLDDVEALMREPSPFANVIDSVLGA